MQYEAMCVLLLFDSFLNVHSDNRFVSCLGETLGAIQPGCCCTSWYDSLS